MIALSYDTVCLLLWFFVANTHVICVKRFFSNLFECGCFSIGADMLAEHQFARERHAWVRLGGGQLQRWLQRQLDAGSPHAPARPVVEEALSSRRVFYRHVMAAVDIGDWTVISCETRFVYWAWDSADESRQLERYTDTPQYHHTWTSSPIRLFNTTGNRYNNPRAGRFTKMFSALNSVLG